MTDEGHLPLPLGEVPEAERAIFTLSVGFAASSPGVGAKGEREERIVTGGNPRRGPRQCELHHGITATGSYTMIWIRCAEHHWLAMTWSFIARGGQWPPLLILSIVLGKSGS